MTNKELIKKITEISPDATTEGLNNKELESLLKMVKPSEAKAPEVEVKPVPKAEVVKKPAVHVMAKGKAITKGQIIYGEGEEVKATGVFSDVFEEYIEKGIIVVKDES